jgi:phosphatidylglycerol:prolipoprotein diacylglycerol transferase
VIEHRIDPVIGKVGRVYLWYYGLSYSLGFLGAFLWFRRQRERLGLSLAEVHDLSILMSGGVVAGGRAVEVAFYERPYYSKHPEHIPWLWLGGMSTHGLLLGGAAGTAIFCALRRRPFLEIADELVIPGALLMGLGRIGNFIDGQIVGSTTKMPWGVKFPDADGARHPVVIYDGIKNLLLVPLLLAIRKRKPKPGVVLANFLLWYGLLRIPVDVFRKYPTRLFGIATGQSLNLLMSGVGAGMLAMKSNRLWPRRLTFAALLALCLVMPSDWTQDIAKRYGKRHPGLRNSKMYPPVSA